VIKRRASLLVGWTKARPPRAHLERKSERRRVAAAFALLHHEADIMKLTASRSTDAAPRRAWAEAPPVKPAQASGRREQPVRPAARPESQGPSAECWAPSPLWSVRAGCAPLSPVLAGSNRPPTRSPPRAQRSLPPNSTSGPIRPHACDCAARSGPSRGASRGPNSRNRYIEGLTCRSPRFRSSERVKPAIAGNVPGFRRRRKSGPSPPPFRRSAWISCKP
jgi:hypothetical protein